MKPRFKVEHVEAALRSTGGLVSQAADSLECTPATVRNYINRHPTLQDALEEIVEGNLDLAENKLIDAIEVGNITAIVFYLRTKGRGRGYVERQEQTGADGQPLIQPATVVILPDNGRGALRQRLVADTAQPPKGAEAQQPKETVALPAGHPDH